jgi:hypothetical protein
MHERHKEELKIPEPLEYEPGAQARHRLELKTPEPLE